jgi:hypothetical protein
MTSLAIGYRGATALWHELLISRAVLFWLMLGGFVWVIGDLFQQYATKYIGISRGIPLSNTNQIWGLFWGIFVFHELRGASHALYLQVAGGSILMALGAVAIALSSATAREHSSWQNAAQREASRYGIEHDYVRAGIEGVAHKESGRGRTLFDWILMIGTTGLFLLLASGAKLPRIGISLGWALALSVAMLSLLTACGIALWRTTQFR